MVGTSSWRQQFREALSIEPIDDEDEEQMDGEKEPGKRPNVQQQLNLGKRKHSILQYIMHYLNLPWKIIFASIPPTDYADGNVLFIA